MRGSPRIGTRCGLGPFPETCFTGRPMEPGQEVPDPRGPVREIGHVPLERGRHEPGEAAFGGLAQLEQVRSSLDRGLARMGQLEDAVQVQQREPNAGAARDDVGCAAHQL